MNGNVNVTVCTAGHPEPEACPADRKEIRSLDIWTEPGLGPFKKLFWMVISERSWGFPWHASKKRTVHNLPELED